MPAEFLTTLVSLGGAGLLLWYLWKQNERLVARIETQRERLEAELRALRKQHIVATELLRAEIKEQSKFHFDREELLREQLAEITRLRFVERTETTNHMWQISQSFQSIAEHMQRENRRAQDDRNDDSGMGDGAGKPGVARSRNRKPGGSTGGGE